ncbi:MAG: hypothetical protein AAGA12_13180 [Pseudomonadota bacterium]
MYALFNSVRTAAKKRSAYIRTYNELSQMSLETAIDLSLFVEDARINARKAVYGA